MKSRSGILSPRRSGLARGGIGVLVACLLALQVGKANAQESMTKMVVRLMGPGIRAGSPAALPRTIYRSGEKFARIEDPPHAKARVEKMTIIRGRDAYSVDLTDRRGTHTTADAAGQARGLPIVLPLDPRRKLGKLDEIEFGSEVSFFEQAGAEKTAGPMINAKPTEEYRLATPSGPASLIVRGENETPVFLKWKSSDGVYRYEYIEYKTEPFDAKLFAKPDGIKWREIAPDPDSNSNR